MDESACGAHPFDTDSGMTLREVFDFAFKNWIIPILQNLGDEVGSADYLGAAAAAATQCREREARDSADSVPCPGLATWLAWMDDPDDLMNRFLS